jgi:hypothetical protein
MVAVQMGSEIGLAPMQALQNIAVIGSRPAIFGDAMAGICRQSPLCEDIEERFEGAGDNLTAICIAKRVGKKPIEQRFSVADATKAGLWNKAGPWTQYPKRMLQMRARGFALRDAFPDVLRGLISTEEAGDMPPDTFTGTTIDGASEQQSETELPPKQEAKPPAKPATTNGNGHPATRTKEQWDTYLAKARAGVMTVHHRADVEEIARRPTVADVVADPATPGWVRLELSSVLVDGYARFSAPGDSTVENAPEHAASAATTPAPEDGDLHIVGEDKVMAGDD